jgi:hypothetical protein
MEYLDGAVVAVEVLGACFDAFGFRVVFAAYAAFVVCGDGSILGGCGGGVGAFGCVGAHVSSMREKVTLKQASKG